MTYTLLRAFPIIGILAAPSTFSFGNILPSDTLRVVRGLGEAKVSAHRMDINVKSTVPQQKLTKESMQTQGIVSITEAFRSLAGINFRDYGGAGGLKTVSVRGLGASHTAVSYDGITLSDCQNGQTDLSRFSIDQLQSIGLTIGDDSEILVPARSIASAAEVKLVSLDKANSDRKHHFFAKLKQGSFSQWGGDLAYGQRFGEYWSFSAKSGFLHADNDYPFTLKNVSIETKEKRTNSRMNSFNVEANISYDNGNDEVDSKIYYYDNARHLPGVVVFYSLKSAETLHERNSFWQTKWKRSFGDRFEFLLNGKLNWDESRYADYDGKYPNGELHQNYWQREAYISAALSYNILGGLKAAYASDYAFNTLTSNLNTDSKAKRHTLLQSLSLAYTSKRITASARILHSTYLNQREQNESAKDERKLSPSASVSWQIVKDRPFYVRTFYKSIFRVPTFTETYYYHLGSTSLKPEQTSQVGFGLACHASYHCIKTFDFTIDAYINKVKDKIVGIPVNLYVWRMINLGKVDARGIDATAKARISVARNNDIIVNANYSWQEVENVTRKSDAHYGKQLAYTPKHTGAASLAWENPWLNCVARISGSSSRWATNEHVASTMLKSYEEVGVGVYRDFRVGNTQWTAKADIQNLMNEQYDVIHRFPMPGRAYLVSLSINY